MKRLALAAVLICVRSAAAENDCRSVEVHFIPSAHLQLVAWIEDANGNYVDTAFITQTTGLRGLGNRPGIMDLKSGPAWPYGSRLDVLPIWAHRHGLLFPQVVWQTDRGCDIQTTYSESSPELFYCRPMRPDEPQWDAATCASQIYTDKGTSSSTLLSHYPPRADVAPQASDSADLGDLAKLNVFDTVSEATPAADLPYDVMWIVPPELPDGNYVVRLEAAKELDFNSTFTQSTFPTSQCRWLDYGEPYRGQPSVLYEVPISVGPVDSIATTDGYAGYSDVDGTVHPPDTTISSDTPGSGASRLRVAVENGSTFQVRVATHPERDPVAPNAPADLHVELRESEHASITFVAPGDDGDVGTVSGYDARYAIGDSLDETSFDSATPVAAITPVAAGQLQTITLGGLAPATPYVVGIRAYDNCHHVSPLVLVRLTTPTAEVSACGCTSADPKGLGLVFLTVYLGRRRRPLHRCPR